MTYPKKIGILFLVAFCACVGLSQQSFAQRESKEVALVAEKNGQQKKFRAGRRIAITYFKGTIPFKVKGIAKTAGGDSVLVYSKTGIFLKSLAVRDIAAVRRVRTTSRIVMFGAVILFMGTAAETATFTGASSSDTNDAIFGTSIVAAPLITLAIPISLLLEKTGEKKVTNGWKFRVQTGTSAHKHIGTSIAF
jgi:hypothetical protein